METVAKTPEKKVMVEPNFRVRESSLEKFKQYQEVKKKLEWHLVHLLKSLMNSGYEDTEEVQAVIDVLSGLHLKANHTVNKAALNESIRKGKNIESGKAKLESHEELEERMDKIEGWLIMLLADLTKAGFSKSHLATQVAASIAGFHKDRDGEFSISSLYQAVSSMNYVERPQ